MDLVYSGFPYVQVSQKKQQIELIILKDYPVLLTSWHLGFATFMTQVLARTTSLLDGRKTVKMTGRVYLRAIVPIGLFFSLSLICGNLTYLYLSVSFIQMLKVSLRYSTNHDPSNLISLGHYSSRCPPCQLGPWRVKA